MAHEFGTPCFVHIQDGGKLDARVEEAIFIGADAESKGHQFYWPGKCRVSVKQNVMFAPLGIAVADDIMAKGEYMTVSKGQTPSITMDAPVVTKPPPTPSTPPTQA
jgi:hypothetical protein